MTPRVEVGSEEGDVAWIKSIIISTQSTSADEYSDHSCVDQIKNAITDGGRNAMHLKSIRICQTLYGTDQTGSYLESKSS